MRKNNVSHQLDSKSSAKPRSRLHSLPVWQHQHGIYAAHYSKLVGGSCQQNENGNHSASERPKEQLLAFDNTRPLLFSEQAIPRILILNC